MLIKVRNGDLMMSRNNMSG